jgi:hypothetical protein
LGCGRSFGVCVDFEYFRTKEAGGLFKHCHAEPVGDEGGGFFAVDFDCEGVFRQELRGGFLFDGFEHKAAADLIAGADRVEEADFVQAVIDAHDLAGEFFKGVDGEFRGHGESEEAMGDGTAEGGFAGGAFGIDVNPLGIFGDVGEDVDARLVDGDPI